MDTIYYKWGDLKSAVRTLLTVDSTRLGLQDNEDGTPGFISLMIRQAVIDLQDFIPQYKKFHETIYYADDFAIEGAAGRAVLPPGARVRDAWLCNFSTGHRYPVLTDFQWNKRFDLIHGRLHDWTRDDDVTVVNDQTHIARKIPTRNGHMCIEPDAYKFYLHPSLHDNWVLSVFWDGKKVDFLDAEETPFTEQTTLAVKDFVKAAIARDVEKDAQMFGSYSGSYASLRRNLYLSEKERTIL